MRKISDFFWWVFGCAYLFRHYANGRNVLSSALIKDSHVKLITTADAEKFAVDEFTLGLVTRQDKRGQWYSMPGGIGRIETLGEYAMRWVQWKAAPDRRTKKRRWFWQVPKHMPKMYYRQKYYEPIFQQIPILSDLTVYKHAKDAGIDVSPYFVVSGGTGKDNPLTVVCTALRWKDQYVEEHMRDLDPDREEADAA